MAAQTETQNNRSFPWSGWEPRDLAPLISLIVLVLFFTIAIPRFQFLRLGTLEIILRQAAVLAIVSVGLTFVLLCGEIDLSVGHMALWTACFCGVLLKQLSAAGTAPSIGVVLLCIGVPLLSSLALGFCSGVLTVTSKLPSFIITLAMMNIANGLAKYITKSEKFAVPEILEWFGNRGISLGKGVSFPYNTFLAALIMVVGHVVLTHTRFGRYVYMTGGNREAARLAGVRTHWIVVSCLAISAVTAGLGGLLNAGRMNAVSLDQNADLLLNAVA
jgi:ribose transport system permease protein